MSGGFRVSVAGGLICYYKLTSMADHTETLGPPLTLKTKLNIYTLKDFQSRDRKVRVCKPSINVENVRGFSDWEYATGCGSFKCNVAKVYPMIPS